MVGREKKIKRNIMDSLGRRKKKAEEIKRKFNPHPPPHPTPPLFFQKEPMAVE
jgi:hypothetical protein